MATILVIRHSRTIGNQQGILMGASQDSPLTDEGIAIATLKGKNLFAKGFKPDKVFTSELGRTQRTAEIILEQLSMPAEYTRLAALNERNFGIHEGKPYQSVLDAFDSYGENPPTIEPVANFVARVTDAWERIKSETTGTTLVITHSNPEMVMQTLAFKPKEVMRFWELGDPVYCEGFEYDF